MTEVISIDQKQKGKDAFQISDSNSKTVGFLNSSIAYKDEYLKLGFNYIDKGISKFPTRLDMRFGKIYMLGKNEDYENFTVEIIKAIDYSDIIKTKWTWTDNKPLDDSKKFMLSAVQDYVVQLYNTNNDALLDNMKRIAETVLKYYPDHVESLSNLSIVYMIKKEYDKAIEVLLKAEKLAPKDYIVLSNIAQGYKLKGDKNNAIKYYELTVKYGDDSAKQYAKGQIDNLKKQ